MLAEWRIVGKARPVVPRFVRAVIFYHTWPSRKKEDKSSIPQCITSNYIINVRTLKSHHFRSFWYGCAGVASSASAGVSKIQIGLSISSIRSTFRSLLGLVYLSWSRNVMHVSCLHNFSFEAAIALILSANDYSITLCYNAYAQWSNIVCTTNIW